MKVTVAIDSLKGSLTSREAGEAARSGILDICPDAAVFVRPIADGGEGTLEAIVDALGGEYRALTVSDPLMRQVKASYGAVGKTAVIEIASAAGLTLVKEEERDPLLTSTYGVGEMIKDAVCRGVREFIIGLGGSATNDGGTGMLKALGFRFCDKNGKDIENGAAGLRELAFIDVKGALSELSECSFRIACDVENPLCGELGASAVFAPQKGADKDAVRDMDIWLSRYADLTKTVIEKADKNAKGAGAAGGLGFAFMTYLNGRLEHGIDLIIEKTRLEDYIKDSDIVITGEGRLDSQTVMGKTPIGVARLAKKYGKTVIAFAGCVSSDAEVCNGHGIDALFPIVRGAVSLEEAMDSENAKKNMEFAARQAFRLIKAVKSL